MTSSYSTSLLIAPDFNQPEYIHITPQSAHWEHLSFAARRMDRSKLWHFRQADGSILERWAGPLIVHVAGTHTFDEVIFGEPAPQPEDGLSRADAARATRQQTVFSRPLRRS